MVFTFRSILKGESRRIGFLYLISCAVFILVGASAALGLQIDMFSTSTRVLNPDQFGKLLTEHGMAMVFVVLLPLLPGSLGNLVLPAALGTRNLAMPRWNFASWLCHLVGGVLVLVSIELGAYTNGWTMFQPPAVPALLFGTLIAGLSLCAASVVLLALCILRSMLSTRHRSITLKQFPLLVWFFLFWALIHTLVTPIRLVTLALTFAAQNNAGSYLSLLDASGIVRYQQLFWLYAGPAILATLLPAIGITYEVLAAQLRSKLPSRTMLVAVGGGLSMLIMMSWGQHLVTAPEQEKLAAVGSLFAALTVVPLLLFLTSWLGLVVRVRNLLTVPLIFIWMQLAAMVLMTLTILVKAIPALGVYLHNSYFTVAQLHLLLLGTVLTSFLAGLFHWLPIATDREYKKRPGYLVAAGFAIGSMATFLPMFLLGTQGSPKGLQDYPSQFQSLHLVSSIGAIILFSSLLLGIAIAIWSYFKGVPGSSDEKLESTGGEFSYVPLATGHLGRDLK